MTRNRRLAISGSHRIHDGLLPFLQPGFPIRARGYSRMSMTATPLNRSESTPGLPIPNRELRHSQNQSPTTTALRCTRRDTPHRPC